ncbi:adherens junction-associated protein 1 isoform X1 [Electrophorus electricus]|uniref:adherens junction-associated protein 1 isoform X1 n=2 Tax=Electrophorus electricus TaxID=8005 RepID=UPI0015CFE592|nr:adherens junction-associated protein 1 isoform X1 [Electrophorus electricus]
MWIKRCIARSSMAALRPSGVLGCRMWIFLGLVHLTMDLSLCAPAGQALTLKLLPRPVPRLKSRSLAARDTPGSQHWRTLVTWQRSVSPSIPLSGYRGGGGGPGSKLRAQRHRRHLCEDCSSGFTSSEGGESLEFLEGSREDIVRYLERSRRQLKWDSYYGAQEGRTTTVAGFIDWGPTGTDEGSEDEIKMIANTRATTKASTTTTTTTTSITTTSTRSPQRTYAVVTTAHPRRLSTTQPNINLGVTARPQKPFVDTPGLAVHQIITITVSLIMVIAALITTLVLKNCCAQSGNGHHTSHQRKITQQEESCQNLTDFTPARVPSKVDIFTAYNDSLQCSHECVRTAVPVYTDEMIQHTPIYKTAYNGSRPSPTERQLIPVAFVSEKWFEISC